MLWTLCTRSKTERPAAPQRRGLEHAAHGAYSQRPTRGEVGDDRRWQKTQKTNAPFMHKAKSPAVRGVRRYERCSLLVTSNLAFSEQMTAAVLDRLTHRWCIFYGAHLSRHC